MRSTKRLWIPVSIGILLALVLSGAAAGLFIVWQSGPTEPDGESLIDIASQLALPRDTVGPKIEPWVAQAEVLQALLNSPGAQVLQEMNYGSRGDLERILTEEEPRIARQLAADVESLSENLEEISAESEHLEDELAAKKLQFLSSTELDSQSRAVLLDDVEEMEDALSDEQKRVAQLELLLPSLKRQVESFRLPDSELRSELEILTALERAPRTGGRYGVGSAALRRAESWISSPNEHLVLLAVRALLISGEIEGIELALKLINQPEQKRDSRAELCWLLVLSGRPDAIEGAVERYRSEPQLLDSVEGEALMTAVNRSPEPWRPLLPVLLQRAANATTAQAAFQLACRLNEAACLTVIDQVATTGALANSPELVVDGILQHRWAEAYAIVGKLLAANPQLELGQVATPVLQACLESTPDAGNALAKHLVTNGSVEQVEWAVDAYCAANEDQFSFEHLAQRVGQTPRQPPIVVLNRLLHHDTEKALQTAKAMLQSLQDIEATQIDIGSIGPNACQEVELRRLLEAKLWTAGREGRGWVFTQLLGPTFAAGFHQMQLCRREQRQTIESITGVLGATERVGSRGLLRLPVQTAILRKLKLYDPEEWEDRNDRARSAAGNLKQTISKFTPDSEERATVLQAMTEYLDLVADEAEVCWQLTLEFNSALDGLQEAQAQVLGGNYGAWGFRVVEGAWNRYRGRKDRSDKYHERLSQLEEQVPRFTLE